MFRQEPQRADVVHFSHLMQRRHAAQLHEYSHAEHGREYAWRGVAWRAWRGVAWRGMAWIGVSRELASRVHRERGLSSVKGSRSRLALALQSEERSALTLFRCSQTRARRPPDTSHRVASSLAHPGCARAAPGHTRAVGGSHDAIRPMSGRTGAPCTSGLFPTASGELVEATGPSATRVEWHRGPASAPWSS